MLVNIPLDVQITICTLLRPSDILSLRQTCKTLQPATRKRVVWVTALHRVCLDNTLFLPSFPIVDMSDAELEHAAMAPHRWNELCAAFDKQHPNDPGTTLRPRTTRIIEGSSFAADCGPLFSFVPGGRYMVSYSYGGIHVWDLGYTPSADCKLIASVGPQGESEYCMVQATPDGMGLIILTSRYNHCCVYEIYPQSETPQPTHIARLDFNPNVGHQAYLLPDRVVFWYRSHEDKVHFRVWDYRANRSISFSVDIDIKSKFTRQVIATKTAIIILCEERVLICSIPPLSPQSPDFFNHNPTFVPSVFEIAYPDGIITYTNICRWHTMSHWYSGSSQPLYFDILCGDSKRHRFEIIVKPDLLDTSLHLINTELVAHDFSNIIFQPYCICEDALVACWVGGGPRGIGVYSGLTSRFTTVISRGGLVTGWAGSGDNFFLSPASGRYVYVDEDLCRIVVVDLL